MVKGYHDVVCKRTVEGAAADGAVLGGDCASDHLMFIRHGFEVMSFIDPK
jgi:hypothetical protein